LESISRSTSGTATQETWELPHGMDNSHKTFIDHNCILNKEGYPIYPSRLTQFVRLPSQSITNFGTVGFSKRCTTEYRGSGTWKVVRYQCLGVLVCDIETCEYAGPPPTGPHKIEEMMQR
jgi:hypothetical protein